MEKRFTVWVGGFEVNDYYLTKEDAEDLKAEYVEKGYDDAIIESKKGSIKASSFIEWYFSDESDYRDLGRDVAFNLKQNGYYNMTTKRVFDGCGYVPEHICDLFEGEDSDEDGDLAPSDLIFIDDITEKSSCHKCKTEYTGDLDFCPNCGNCVS